MVNGVILSLSASFLFSMQYYLSASIHNLSGLEIFGWRTIISFPLMTIFFFISRKTEEISTIWMRVIKKPRLILGLLLCSGLMTLQQWLFIWAPVNGKGLDVSLGYFMLPLVMVLAARLLYGEKLSRLKILATSSAMAGVLNEIYRAGGFSWPALTVCFGFSLYFIVRKKLKFNTLGGLWFDMALMLPFACWAVIHNNTDSYKIFYSMKGGLLISTLGMVSAVAFMAYISAGRLLSFSLFGLMGYVEPVLLVLAAILIGEKPENKELLTYAFIWIAVLFLIWEGVRQISDENKVIVKDNE